MRSYFYALWIPQYKEGEPHAGKLELEEAALRDRDEDPELWVSGKIEKDTLLIRLSYTIDKNPQRTLTFQKTESSNEGFIIYRLTLDDNENDFLCNRLRTTMPKAIYHYLKEFFHVHQFHSSGDDSLLEAYFSENPIDLNDASHLRKILKVYLQSYIYKYEGCVSLCRDRLYDITKNVSDGVRISASHDELKMLIDNNQIVLDGESMYCDFLINSFPDLVDQNQLHRIYSQRNELARYDDRLQRLESALTSQKSLKLGWIGFFASMIGALVGVVVSLLLGQCSSSELKEGISTIRKDIQLIEAHDSLSSQDIQHVKQNQDSILKLLNKPTPKK
ncbi:MAG: hypothetical protein IJK46_10710 [Prevotella sp.]|nr:hypothetical protein [Prevotella sp.]